MEFFFESLKELLVWEKFYEQITNPQSLEISFSPSPEIEKLLKKEGFQEFGLDKSFYLFKDNQSKILSVAHLDTCLPITPPVVNGSRIYSTGCDDRMGLHVILQFLMKLGVNIDILLTQYEEEGNSTAKYFNAPRQYNWVFEFDRKGEDVVLYQHDTPFLRNILECFWFEVNWGIYSDIASLKLPCAGFNFGVGYHEYHSEGAYTELYELYQQICRFMIFYSYIFDLYLPTPFEGDVADKIYEELVHREEISHEHLPI